MLGVEEKDESKAIRFLKKEYEKEVLNFPYDPPPFDANAALWAAKTIYISAQLVLFREIEVKNLLNELLPDYSKELSPSKMLSADLTLRFMPDLLRQLQTIDLEDPLIRILEPKLSKFHYSGVNYNLDLEALDFNLVNENQCFRQLYANRIIQYKRTKLASHPAFSSLISSNLSIYKNEIWKDFEVQKISTDE